MKSRVDLTNWEGPNQETQLSLKRLQINFFSRLFHRGRLRRCLSSLLYILFYLLKQLWLKEEITTIYTNFTDKWQKKKTQKACKLGCVGTVELETQLFCEEGIAELLLKNTALKIDGWQFLFD